MDALVQFADASMRQSTDYNQTPALQSADLVLSRKSKSFHWARCWMAPTPAARATRLYGFCRYVDDLADEVCLDQDLRLALASVVHDIATGVS